MAGTIETILHVSSRADIIHSNRTYVEVKIMGKEKDLAPETRSAQALRQIDTMTGGLSPAIHPSSTYLRDENYQLIEHRYSIEGESSPVPRDWLRLSIGIESVGDLIADLEQALG